MSAADTKSKLFGRFAQSVNSLQTSVTKSVADTKKSVVDTTKKLAPTTPSPSPAKKAKRAVNVDTDAARITLRGGAYHSAPVYADGKPDDQKGKFHWYRSAPGGHFGEICETQGNRYQPCFDDIGARICCQFQPEQGLPSGFAEIGPMALDPAYSAEAVELIKTIALFPVTLVDQSSIQLEVCAEAVVLHSKDAKVSQKSRNSRARYYFE
jgi:hypothetical protein